jgi:ADP-ribose pyrophosphatase YjhB (NUDIX family)
MNKEILVKLSDGSELAVKINKPELIYGATAIITNKIIEGYSLNPINGKQMPFIYDADEETRFFIPAHIQKDYLYAKKHNLEIFQVVAPYFLGSGEEEPRGDVDTQIRYSVVVVIKNSEKDSYLCEDAKGRSCKSFVMGGIEDGETIEEAAKRETFEETGYSDLEIEYVSNFFAINHFYAGYKGVNRYAYINFVFGTLNNMNKKEIINEEKRKHDVLWIDKDKLNDFINIDLNKYALKHLFNGESAFEDDGVMVTFDSNNGKLSSEVRKEIIEKYCINEN